MSYHPPVGFSFKVEFEDISTSNGDNSFQSVSGLSVDLETEEIAEGGENRFKHKIPVRSKYPNLVLKRGMLVDSEVIKWCKKALENFEIQPVNINVMLLGEDQQTIQTWNVVHAYPIKWNVGDFNAEESKLVIETLELTYNYFKVA
ncbi:MULTISPECIES: phage tail protein [Tenacibaculum]|uniref:Phage tail-like protein n=1 Tax=Tenacibaculum caenipelagi TaxID=1325435 RepID=A0A4R6TF23_9FLAO|nr:phage tail protein [Tenacibaculum caenipelagi]TDQ22702.1 phage tail-like protein [Tenacibaculum caenipelagi]